MTSCTFHYNIDSSVRPAPCTKRSAYGLIAKSPLLEPSNVAFVLCSEPDNSVSPGFPQESHKHRLT